MPVVRIESMDHEGRGVTHFEGKVIFVDGALTGELIDFSPYVRKPSYELAQISRILKHSPQRVQPRCRYFGTCGGCSMQHLDVSAQASVKQRVLEDALWHIGRVKPETVFTPLIGPGWGYRYRARLSVRHVSRKGGVLVGFRERKSSHVTNMSSCEVLPPHMSALLLPLRELINGFSICDRVPQVEVAIGGEGAQQMTVLVFRVLAPLSAEDEAALRAFSDTQRMSIYVQPGGPDTLAPFWPLPMPELAYELPDFGVRLAFAPSEFTQVNHGMNRSLLRRAMSMLAPQPGERIADMFCGLGNFSLPIAALGADVVGVEGADALVQRAARNAEANGLASRASFRVANLFKATPESLAELGHFDKMVIDPPREGAFDLVKALPRADAAGALQRIVYVSCSAATLARDVAVLVNEKGYRFRGAGIANMFPQTSHVESIALIER
ncbi:23S rRNA (uracil(1939)-C(5))-methyltransferase RlmD [Methyloversatilis sp.]|uniref:23S rRNA (uracil(1939)-C(5))-methyltransferase RlmD n=1 Tax=Methyloversatilis sp. TaxID=2569862 RepID=UPI0027332725|nr:23S rRNA (uracil(1939)-C(5))-methyltransferase RlmD [Methyloversatilis sp.]MDP2868998.1 23S rRNA (uracil(1939)-C(5))-methyltransferase RlmD [Methyloversatilis sp.]MDP3454226.1 23S rRNA (uracil(1939)-C(5))-methyltransferase RlmD [Methyloversatilis sp.]MDP3578392.1 23S rRNA (uracil(1939)-C(5))-methyltransferase RlmD [Methyloversatilis sp.]